MSTKFNEVRLQVLNDINQQTVETLNTLTNVWTATFEDKLCTINAETLVKHVKMFYNDLIEETTTRQAKINLDINQLYSEALHLKKLLKVDINLKREPDCPLYSFQLYLTECLQILREQLEHRQGKIDILLEEQKQLCSELPDVQYRELKVGSKLATDDNLTEFRQYLDDLIEEKHKRQIEFNKLRIDIEILLMKVDVSLVNTGDDTMLNDPCLPLTKENLSKLYILRTNLQNHYNDMREEIDRMKEKLNKLWDVLNVNDIIRKQFDNAEYNKETYNHICRNLEHWEQVRQSNLSQFVHKAREEISFWWKKNLYSEQDKKNISILNSSCFTEDLLTAHEMELNSLKCFHNEHQKLFSLIEERDQFWERMRALEGKAQEPGRYTNRGGQLLKEEKERKMISKRLPAIEHEILVLAENYQKSTNKIFTVHGVPVAELIEQEWAKMNEYKQEIKFTRKKTTECTTPTFPPPKLKRQISTVKKVISVSNIASANGNGNRFHVLKHLLKDIPAQKKLVTPNKTPKKLTYPTQRRSTKLRKSSDRRISTGRVTKTHIQINNSARTDSVNYDSFENYITPRSPCRSSLVSPKDKVKEANTSKRVILTPIPGTPTSTKKLHINKSPMANRNYSPRSSPSVRKFSTVTLPILI